ncbi:RHBL4 protein, partial [Polyodon spathula]|nr:rhomboid-related protein 4 isoform X1 [Polyodon spathula]XP_041126728.1 rhomboid-related protein 4 isoform X1 [Polyodon spathula]XP_041126729.1 rhomboid-related protein 4 isoform X1 [Polyodon spathula]XP_041126730.1 rhomboid-related protein 4 isoform X1 [Polyodon spathula]XP_041126731.1 rhomboid-related protein 4 isoform X1 [Polyodon spathula]MBN3275724.1 RHBL4 protein [Polyodon spathula]
MRSRQRGVNLGFLMLISQLFRIGPSNVPPVTLATLGLNIYLFLAPQKQLLDVCISVQNAYIYKDWTRLIFSPFYHADDWHLYFNMVSLLWKGIQLERRLGSPWFAYIIGVFSLMTGVVYIILEMVLTEFTKDPSYSRQCAVGFSGVLFALKVINNHYFPGGVAHVFGFPIANKYACWVELVAIHLVSPGTSFVGHLAGIVVGLLYTKGPLKKIMKMCAGVVSSDGGYSRGSYFNYSGYSGPRSSPIRSNTYNAYNQYSPNNTYSASNEAPGYEPYTGGLSEEEQYQAAIRASLNDQGSGHAQRRPNYGFNIPTGPLTWEEIRQRRLNRFEG